MDSKKKDIQELKQALLKANQDIERLSRVKSDFVSIISHELRTPLTSIKESVSLVLDGVAGPLNENQSEFLNIAKNNIDRLARLITDILDFSKLESGRITMHKKKANINELVRNVFSSVKDKVEKRGLYFELELSDGLDDIWFDPDRIGQVLNNLISNAIKFNKEKGRIRILGGREEIGGREFVKVIVEDTGMGINKNEMPSLFNHFSPLDTSLTRANSGVGLGLAISKHIIALHGGDIWAESDKDIGSRFIFTLPVYKKDNEFNFLLDDAIERAIINNMSLALIFLGVKDHADLEKEIALIVRGPEDKVVRCKQGNVISIMAGTDRAGAGKIIDRLKAKLTVHINFGVAVYPDEAKDRESLIKKAEKDLKTGKNFI
ncbi:MAG: hypothetical protein KKD90_00515 [Candidatus Omnitrophica bacterium]|nr:hypothetical protein [Candidatus Omnitrophota bacterium]MBU4148936.1 hypothetical protein [Candidatus Omnitrophota bacterium]